MRLRSQSNWLIVIYRRIEGIYWLRRYCTHKSINNTNKNQLATHFDFGYKIHHSNYVLQSNRVLWIDTWISFLFTHKIMRKKTNVTLNDILDIDIIFDLIHSRQVQLNFLTPLFTTLTESSRIFLNVCLSVDYKLSDRKHQTIVHFELW